MTSRSGIWFARVAVLLMCGAGTASAVRADPLTFNGTFFAIDSAGTRLDLFSNPGAVLEPSTYGGTTFPAALLFGAFVNHDGAEPLSDTIRFTYHETGTAPVIYEQLFNTAIGSSLGFGAAFEPIHRTGQPVATTLTVELLNSAPDFVIPSGPLSGEAVDSYTYSFFTLATVPEPSTWVLVLSGGAAALLPRVRRLFRMSPPRV